MDRPTLVLPTPGAPTKHSMGPGEGEGGGERKQGRESLVYIVHVCTCSSLILQCKILVTSN